MNEKIVDLESMRLYVEIAFVKVLNEEFKLCVDISEADLMFYMGYFTLASELGIITEDRKDDMFDTLVYFYNYLRGHISDLR